MSKIISEICKAIYTVLKDPYLTPPDSKEEWLEIFKNFEEVWNMPHVIECIDGKHIRVECPKLSGTLYYNYKGFFSIVLMALCGANYCFTLFDLGFQQRQWHILANSKMGKMFEEDLLNVPPDCKLSEDDERSLPYFLLEDEIFPLKKWLMRSYPGKNVVARSKSITINTQGHGDALEMLLVSSLLVGEYFTSQ